MSARVYLEDGEVIIDKGGHRIALDAQEAEEMQEAFWEATEDAKAQADFARIEREQAAGIRVPGIPMAEVRRRLGL